MKHKKFQKITANVSGKVTTNSLDGKDYTVVPMVMIVEGVLNGNTGPLLYTTEELSKTPVVWNHKPVVVNHPPNGDSACTVEYINSNKIGMIMNAHFENNKLKADAYIDVDKASFVDSRIVENIQQGNTMELSTGLFTDIIQEKGQWEGTDYDGLAINYRPDHLAVLPDAQGACSVADGAGFLRLNAKKEDISKEIQSFIKNTGLEKLDKKRHFSQKLTALLTNELSFSDISEKLYDALNKEAFIEEVYKDFFIYKVYDTDVYSKQKYSLVEEKIVFQGEPETVSKKVSYEPTVNSVNNRKAETMDKEKIVSSLIDNEGTSFTKDDREHLMSIDESILEKMIPTENEESEMAEESGEEKETIVNEEKTEETVSNLSLSAEEYISSQVPKTLQPVLMNGLKTYNEQKKILIGKITSNEKNIFTKEILLTKDLDELKGMAALAEMPKKTSDDEIPVLMNYSGQGETVSANAEMEPLVMETMSFEDSEG